MLVMRYFFAACVAVVWVGRVCCDEVPPSGDAQYHNEQAKERIHLLQHLADRMDLDGEGLRHIKKHLQEVAGTNFDTSDIQDIQKGNNAKGIFYFFQLHDFDNNQKLDGLEWMAALTDYHRDEGEKGHFKEGGEMFLENEAEAIVDELLEKHDKDGDGFIDFFELMKSDVSSLMNELDQPPEGGNAEQQEQPSPLEQELQQQQQQPSSLEQEFQEQQQQVEENESQAQDQSNERQQQEQQQQGQESQGDSPHQDESSKLEQQEQEPSSLEQEYAQQQEQGR